MMPVVNPGFNERDQRLFSGIALLVGIILTIGGLFGIWFQGTFYEGGFQVNATFSEVRLAFTLPAATTLLGTFIITGVIFSSRLTAGWSQRRKLAVFVGFGIILLVSCAVCGHLATLRAVNQLR